MNKILILGALPKNKKEVNFYTSLKKIFSQYSNKIDSPIETVKFKGSDKARYNRAFKKVLEADLIVGELSKPSTGQGMEIREAVILNKPLIIIAKQNSKISGLVKACPNLNGIIYYKSLKDLVKSVEKTL